MASDDYSDQISIRDLMGVLQQMDAKLPEESKVVLRFRASEFADWDDEVLVPVSVSALQGIGEPSELIIYVEHHNPDGDSALGTS